MALAKYLKQYAEAEASELLEPPHKYRQAMVIPAYRESGMLLEQLAELLDANHNSLVILVINCPDTAPESPELAATIQEYYPRLSGNTVARYYDAGKDSTLLVVDRYSPGRAIPVKQGVGLARKIGCDIACRFIHEAVVESPWIFSSDADTCWPKDYFDIAIRANPNASALIYPFRHISVQGQDSTAIQLYEFSLHYYVAGLHHAGSPYAHYTIGSTIAINYRHYARVRGFPKRSGGEDFYLLNKLAKSGPVVSLAAPLLLIEDRDSDRVPFGTGPARQRITELAEPLAQYPLYHPDCFSALRQALALIREVANSGDPIHAWQQQLQNPAPELPPWLRTLEQMGMAKAVEHAAQHSDTGSGCYRHLCVWFDAFRSLKFIHALRDQNYPSISFKQLMARDSFLLPILAENEIPLDGASAEPHGPGVYNQALRACNSGHQHRRW